MNKTMGIASPKDLAGKKICFLGGTEIETQLQGYMQREKIKWLPFPFSEEGEMEAAFVTGNCAAISADVSQLSYERIAFKNRAKNFDILPDVIAKDPLAPTYRLDDPQWAAIVNWTVEALIQAEESGVTQANLAEMKKSDDVVIQRLLGVHRGYGQYHRARRRLGCTRDRSRGQLWRDVRARPRLGVGEEAAPRSQQPLDARRAHVRAPHPLRAGWCSSNASKAAPEGAFMTR